MQHSTTTGRGAVANYNDLVAMTMRDTTNNTGSAKAFDESNIEPVANSKTYSSQDMMSMASQATAKGQKKQRRANDGKFEAIKTVGMYDSVSGKAEGRAGNDRKANGRKAGGVEAAFYNSNLGGTPLEEDKVPEDRWPLENDSAIVIP